MGRNTRLGALLATLLGVCGAGATECETEYSCGGSCSVLATCESEWLVDEGEEPMSEQETDMFIDTCVDDCSEELSANICIGKASCDELRDGKCTDDFVF
jgi:hypothetical protein